MQSIFYFLDIVSRVLAFLAIAGGILVFMFQSWFKAKIDAHYKRTVAVELEKLKSDFSKELEEEKKGHAAELERVKLELAEGMRSVSRANDMNRNYFEKFSSDFGDVISDISMLLPSNWDEDGKDETQKSIFKAFRKTSSLSAMKKLVQVNKEIADFDAYMDVKHTLPVSKLFKELIVCLRDEVNDQETADKLIEKFALVRQQMKSDLFDESNPNSN